MREKWNGGKKTLWRSTVHFFRSVWERAPGRLAYGDHIPKILIFFLFDKLSSCQTFSFISSSPLPLGIITSISFKKYTACEQKLWYRSSWRLFSLDQLFDSFLHWLINWSTASISYLFFILFSLESYMFIVWPNFKKNFSSKERRGEEAD